MVKMYAVGMLGSYLTQGVYAVASPFQPFGGAVDIIVVQQEDGTFKSSPWYVKFGDSQGAFKSRERIVDILVNDVPADFHMFLDNKGEAYFEKEVEANESGAFALPSASLSSDHEQNNNSAPTEGVIQIQEDPELAASDACRSESPELAEGMHHSNKERLQMLETSSSFAGDSHTCDAAVGNDVPELETGSSEQKLVAQEGLNVGMDPESTDGVSNIMEINKILELEGGLPSSSADLDTNAVSVGVNTDNLTEFFKDTGVVTGEETGVLPDNQRETSMDSERTDNTYVIGLSLDDQASSTQRLSSADSSLTVNLDSEAASLCVCDDNTDHGETETFISVDSNMVTHESIEVIETFNTDSEDIGACEIDESDTLNERDNFDTTEEMITTDNNLILPEKMELLEISSTDSCVNSASTGKLDFKQTECEPTVCAMENPDRNEVTIPVNDGCTTKDRGDESSAAERDVVYKMEEGPAADDRKDRNTNAFTVMPPSRWSLWPLSFRRPKTEKIPLSSSSMPKETILAATSVAMKSPYTEELLEKNGFYKPKVRTYVPTSAQLASLNLKEGPNKVTFAFSRGAGKTQVDARIYSWKWKTRIVISDVDGTITKSDVLGQVMPLVGRDWSQSGVTRLFSAIKDNGYEVLFLSARAISQAYLTRQFLLNLKQDGEALPEGPVFISPDGLIPSLYREVIRRAPHEFKISCLEGIRELFPKDINPFYAGFGNRITDEISYLKVGIPRGKIFIINPKGEVMVNHRVDTKSYTSIHALVDDMFPPMSSGEQEDFNSWNFWKLPLPDIDIELDAKSSKAAKKGGSIKK